MLLLFWNGLAQGMLVWLGPNVDRLVRIESEERRAVVV